MLSLFPERKSPLKQQMGVTSTAAEVGMGVYTYVGVCTCVEVCVRVCARACVYVHV